MSSCRALETEQGLKYIFCQWLPMAINEEHFVQVTSAALLNVMGQECSYCSGSCQLAKATAGVCLFICLYM